MPTDFLERIIISVVFGLAGASKVLGFEFEMDAFVRWGFGIGFMYFIGILEILGALGMWVRHLSPFVALCLAGLALGALGTRLVFLEWIAAAATAVLLAVTLHYAWRHRNKLFPR